MNKVFQFFYNRVKRKELVDSAEHGLGVNNEELWHKYICGLTRSNLVYLMLLITVLVFGVLRGMNII
jgi:hypothetical protein